MLIANKEFEKQTSLSNQDEYECCTFVDCDFSSGNFSATRFIECEFVGCNLSNALVNETSFLDVQFRNCKMIGIQFDTCNKLLFSAEFESCQLDHSTFYEMKLKQISIQDSKLEGADFTNVDLSGSKILRCDLTNAKFEQTNLEGSDLSSSFGFNIDPEQNRIAKAKFSLSQLPGLLTRYNLKIDDN